MMKAQHRLDTPRRWPTRIPMTAVMALSCIALLSITGCELLGLSESEPAQQPSQPAKPPVAAGGGAGANKAGGPGATGGAPGAAGEGEAAENKEAEPQEYQRPDYPENLRRNPFRPVVEVLSPLDSLDGGSEDEARSVEPLERFSVGELELSVIISETAVPKAMFLDPDGFGHVVKEGDRIGRQGGTITDIRDNEVDVQETTGEDESAQSTVRTIRLREVDIQSTKEEGEELSKAEREALQRLLQSEGGRDVLRRNLREQAAEIEQGQPGGQGGGRARGIAPPTQ